MGQYFKTSRKCRKNYFLLVIFKNVIQPRRREIAAALFQSRPLLIIPLRGCGFRTGLSSGGCGTRWTRSASGLAAIAGGCGSGLPATAGGCGSRLPAIAGGCRSGLSATAGGDGGFSEQVIKRIPTSSPEPEKCKIYSYKILFFLLLKIFIENYFWKRGGGSGKNT